MTSNFNTKDHATGIKLDTGKQRYDLLAFDALEGTVAVLTEGSIKYAPRNWELGMSWMRVFGALMRHLSAWAMGQDNDSESGKSHLDHAACCIMFLQAYNKRKVGQDDRVKTKAKARKYSSNH